MSEVGAKVGDRGGWSDDKVYKTEAATLAGSGFEVEAGLSAYCAETWFPVR